MVWLCGAVLLTVAVDAVAADDSPATFYRGLNLNGPAVVIDGQQWDGNDAKDFRCNGQSFANQSVPLKPPTDRQRSEMIRSSRWGEAIDVELTNVPAGVYQCFLYVWEDNNPEKFQVLLNDREVVKQHISGTMGQWDKLGPWKVEVTAGTIKLSARGGHANLSGLEVWAGAGPIPKPPTPQFAAAPTADQLEFFERKIRPLFVEHCYQCHSAEAKEIGGSLLLDSRAGIVKGGDTQPPIVPGDPDASLLMTAVRQSDPDFLMPPKPNAKLSDDELADLAKWIAMGAPDPRTEDTVAKVQSKSAIDWDEARQFWSFRPLSSPPIPEVRDREWPITDIDRFILARLEAEGLRPLGPTDKRTLIRRATYDLIGLPPTPEEVEAFVQDTSAGAFARVVDRLLASPHYGERWGRHWLDVVRYSDTAGDNSDFPIPQMYKYRNWVIDAFNRDLPYDQFVREQLAGDLLPGDTVEERHQRTIATGYIANARRFGSRVDDYPQHLTIEDTLDNLGRAFLGLTLNCARCHDHKFDPITTQDYYALYGVFHSTRYPWPGIELEQKQRDLVPLVSADEVEAAMKVRREKQDELNAEVKRLEKERNTAEGDEKAKLDKALQAAKAAVTAFGKTPLPFEQAYAVAESARIEDCRVQQKGDPAKTGPLVHRRFLTILGGAELSADDHTSGRRQLAEWIVDPHNPLTARVMVNRIWLYHFGRGIVPTPNDFGKQGKPPTHPELLDWLAKTFVDGSVPQPSALSPQPFSIKSLHRLIMLSRTYQLASQPSSEALARDPGNVWLSHFPRRRLDAEAIRDTLLALGGNLDRTVGGPHPFPPQTEWKFTQHNPFKAVYDHQQRSVYLMTQRIQRHPYLGLFDGADPAASTPVRGASTTPLQALFLLNDSFVHEQSQRLAARLTALASDDAARIDAAYQMMFSRPADSDEREAALGFLKDVRAPLAASVAADDVESQGWPSLVRALLRLNEFVYVE
jgi:hypothetical protein